jgi:threonyl-tRNA synthetase
MITLLIEGATHTFEVNSMPVKDALSLSSKLNTEACPIVLARVDGKLVDLSTVLSAREQPYRVDFLNTDDPEGLLAFRHTTSHTMTQAVRRLFGRVNLGVGPPTSEGFYQDYDATISESDIPKIEKEMQNIVREKLPVQRRVVSRPEALDLFANDPFKRELIDGLAPSATISIYTQGEHTDLCAGPHVPNTGVLGGAFKLLRVSGAYWRGDPKKKQLTRITGTAYPTQSALDLDLKRRKEAEHRDHRRIGKEMELFIFSPDSPGCPFFLPRGTIMHNKLCNYKRELLREYGYDEIRTPTILKRRLWEESGHWANYQDKMFTIEDKEDEEVYAVKPMNCPGSAIIFRSQKRSYRDLPLRLAEFGYVHRNESSGEVTGLLRVRAFTQDDAHLYIRQDQISEEVQQTVRMYQQLYDVFGFRYTIALSTRPEKRMGDDSLWDQAENALRQALDNLGLRYGVKEGDGAFYGPKIDFHINDCLGRDWQCGTIQLDFQMPERFGLEYIGADNTGHRPVMIHPAAMGSIERFMAILIEEFEGHFPTWLAPLQVLVLSVAEASNAYALELCRRLKAASFLAEADVTPERIGKKILNSRQHRPPYLLVVGPSEAASEEVSVRDRQGKEQRKVAFQAFVDRLAADISARRREPYAASEFPSRQ